MSHDPMGLIISVTGTWDVSKVPQKQLLRGLAAFDSFGTLCCIEVLSISVAFYMSHDPIGLRGSFTGT